MHVFIEIDDVGNPCPFSRAMEIISLTEGSFVVPERPELYDALALGYQPLLEPEDRDPRVTSRFPPRGLPNPQSLTVSRHFYRLVAEFDRQPNHRFWPGHLCVNHETAQKWIAEGSEESRVLQWFNCPPDCSPDGIQWRVVSVPEFFNASSLSLSELDESIVFASLELEGLPLEFRIVRNSMRQLSDFHGESRVRLVFWFESK